MAFDGTPQVYGLRETDIERTVCELAEQQAAARQKFIRDNVRPNMAFKWNALCYAYVSGMSTGEFMEYFGHLAFANKDGSNSSASHETRATLRGCSIDTSERDTSKLEKRGFLPSEDKKRRRNNSAIRRCAIPEAILDALPLDGQEPLSLMVRDPGTRKSAGSNQSSIIRNPQICGSGTRKSAGLPFGMTLEGSAKKKEGSIGRVARELHKNLDAVSIPRRKQAISEVWA